MLGRVPAIATVIVLGSVVNGCGKPVPSKLTVVDPQAKALQLRDMRDCMRSWRPSEDGGRYGTNGRIACARNAETGVVTWLGLDDGRTPVLRVRLLLRAIELSDCAPAATCRVIRAQTKAARQTLQAVRQLTLGH